MSVATSTTQISSSIYMLFIYFLSIFLVLNVKEHTRTLQCPLLSGFAVLHRMQSSQGQSKHAGLCSLCQGASCSSSLVREERRGGQIRQPGFQGYSCGEATEFVPLIRTHSASYCTPALRLRARSQPSTNRWRRWQELRPCKNVGQICFYKLC